jgi:glycerol-3-phosphate dehydrogenase
MGLRESRLRPALDNERFDVAVIGGGINGVAIARECAHAGRRVLLVEQQDFASGTTSRSTRIIHGGLRYLEHGDIAQVRESLREREWLRRRYPGLVRPLQFLLALDEKSHRSALAVRTGLWLYRWFDAGAKGSRAAGEPRAEQEKLERLLDAGRRFSVFSFDDAQCEFPERLVAEWLVDAMEDGAIVRNHTEVLEVEIRDGRACGLRLRDRFSRNEERTEAQWIINAAGPWVDAVCESSRFHTQTRLVGGVRGSHIVLPKTKLAGSPNAAVYTEAVDGRPIFIIPWNHQILVGTTEVPDQDDPGRVRPSGQEIEYLLQSLANLFPQSKVCRDDISYAFAGVRPLPFSSGKNPSAVSRKHYLHDHTPDGAAGMISVIGGKLTTAGSLARECSALITKMAGHANEPLRSGLVTAAEEGMDSILARNTAGIAATAGVDEATARGIVEWFGRRSSIVARLAEEREELRMPLCPHTGHIVAEAVHALSNESAATLGDVLLRRVPVALGGCWSATCSGVASQRIAAAMGWNEQDTAAELELFESERDAFLVRTTNASSQTP